MKTKIEPIFSDDRGHIIDIVTNDNIDHVNMLTFSIGAKRGNHYHKDTIQKNYLVSGEVQYYESDIDGVVDVCTMNPGDMTISLPNRIHAFIATKESVMIVMTTGPRGGVNYEQDTFRKSII